VPRPRAAALLAGGGGYQGPAGVAGDGAARGRAARTRGAAAAGAPRPVVRAWHGGNAPTRPDALGRDVRRRATRAADRARARGAGGSSGFGPAHAPPSQRRYRTTPRVAARRGPPAAVAPSRRRHDAA